MYGRVRLYNVGFAIFTLGSILLYLTPDIGEAGAIEIIVFRLVNAILNAIPQSVVDTIDPETIKILTGTTWFPTTLAQAFMPSLRLSFYFGAILSIIATFFSVMRGPKHADRISKVEDRNPIDERK